MSLETLRFEKKAKIYQEDFRKLNHAIKDWKAVCLKEVSCDAEECYNAFNDFQMELIKIKDSQKIHQIKCYKKIYNFLTYVETKLNTDFAIYIINNSSAFSRLINHFSQYCAKMEKKYAIQLDIERKIGLLKNPSPTSKSVQKK